MQLHFIDYSIFAVFIVAVVAIGILGSRHEKDSESYFLAGRGLPWWLIGFSLIAANISTEQFVGMSGSAADRLGMAIASYEWLAAVTLVVVAFFFLPYFLRTGIYTIPEFLERRFNRTTRSIMAFCMVLIYILLVGAVTYSGALTIETAFHGKVLFGFLPITVTTGAWFIGIMAAAYVATGGLKACAWADLIQGSALIIGGGVIMYFALQKLGITPLTDLASSAPVPDGLTDADSGMAKFTALNSHKFHMVLPRTDPFLPWTTLILGLWIPNFYYWGLNQYIMQRTLGSKSLAEGQKGIVFAALMKLFVPFIIVMPGMIAFNLFSGEMRDAAEPNNDRVLQLFEEAKAAPSATTGIFIADEAWQSTHPEISEEISTFNEAVTNRAKSEGFTPTEEKLVGYKYDTAFGFLISKVLPEGSGWQGFVLAALLGAVVSTLASMLNAASTIVTMDIYRLHISPDASQKRLVGIGRILVGVFAVLGCWLAPKLGDPRIGNSIFAIIQEGQAYIYSGILAVFLVGMLVRRAPPITGTVGLLLGPASFWTIKQFAPGISFVDRASLAFGIVLVVLLAITAIKPLAKPVQLATTSTIDLTPSKGAKALGVVVILLTITLYIVFW
ncbi:MAG: sodium/solute symporter [Akkermansiaceae bacterium]|jgi:solute:Na+ symporter, SSS family|nr:sodium/solute symporter [Akkermansiaceae bacterium]MDP4721362.1 sodium/solute symporter [Akkermansiaceae bacterium]MDP4779417.1 sodium/solute symporter [Akkermansiaceae bacterium]MDP4846757.1 sodium/solute symporter [Akkermansiaceae bacterium]MDP4897094.1 sodium/solute symporter [Akkermansiaceae bacterium]